MSKIRPETLRVDVGDTELGVVRWPGDGPTVVAVHGITANAWSWSAVARHLEGRAELLAVDLRGRGASADAPPPFGMRRHADDLAAICEQLGRDRVVAAGHSMGAYVVLTCAERHPALVSRLVLVDGGHTVPLPDGMSPQDALDATIGPAIARLQRVWADRVEYRTMWSEHPAFAAGLTPELERYLLSDLTPCEGGFRSVVNEQAVRSDGAELLVDDEMRSLLERRIEPAVVVRAETGLMATPPPFVGDEWIDRCPQHDWRFVAGANHYTVLVGDDGASVVADALVNSPT